MKHRNSRFNFCRRDSYPLLAFFVTAILLVFGASQSLNAPAQAAQTAARQADKGFHLTSAAFDADAAIPAKFSCTGANVSPALAWTDPPAGTQSFALVVDDPDAPSATPVVHWLIYGIPATQRTLQENTPKKPTLPDGSKQGKNTAGKIGYGGPCPDPGEVHHYFFKLYALDYTPNLKPKLKIADIEAALKDHVLAKSELIGRFQRE